MPLVTFLFSIMAVCLHGEFFPLSSRPSINICLLAILKGVAERCCCAMWRPHSWQTYNFMRAIYRTHLVRIVSVRASKHLKPHFWLANCSSALYYSRLFGRYSSIYLFIYYCLLRILATNGFWFCVSCLCRQRGFENYILFEDKPADITYCLLYLASRCHLTKIGSRHSCLPHTEKRCCFAAKPNHYWACVYQHIYGP